MTGENVWKCLPLKKSNFELIVWIICSITGAKTSCISHTTSWNQLGFKKEAVAHKQSWTGFCCPWLLKLNKRDIIAVDETKKFKKEAQCFNASTLKKLFDRSPFTCDFVRYCAVLNSAVLVSCEQKSFQNFKLLLNELMKLNILSSSQCDTAAIDFTSFCSNEFKKFRVEFEEFKEESDRLHNSFFQDGQASAVRQFSVYNQVLDNNKQIISLVARKHIINHMKVNQLTPHSIIISKDLLLSVKGTSTRYRIYLE